MAVLEQQTPELRGTQGLRELQGEEEMAGQEAAVLDLGERVALQGVIRVFPDPQVEREGPEPLTGVLAAQGTLAAEEVVVAAGLGRQVALPQRELLVPPELRIQVVQDLQQLLQLLPE